MIIRMAPPEHYGWLVERVGVYPTAALRALEAVEDTKILGMVGFDVWMGNAAQMHFAIDDSSVAKILVREAMHYVFTFKDMVIGWLPESKDRLRKMAAYLGYREVHRFKNGWAVGDDLIMYELRREWCRFVGKA